MSLKNVLYAAVLSEPKESPDGEFVETLELTEETNGFFCWTTTYEDGLKLLWWQQFGRFTAIERAVAEAHQLRQRGA
jgi:hypothetical protein